MRVTSTTFVTSTMLAMRAVACTRPLEERD